MKTALRTTLAVAIVAAFAPLAAFAQAQSAPAAATSKPPLTGGKVGKPIRCPDGMHGSATEQVQPTSSGYAWKVQSPPAHKGAYLFAEMSLAQPQQPQAKGGPVLTCKYHDLDTVLAAALPQGCVPKLVGPWNDGSNVGKERIVSKVPSDATCKGAPPPPPAATGSATGKKPVLSQPITKPGALPVVPCAVEC